MFLFGGVRSPQNLATSPIGAAPPTPTGYFNSPPFSPTASGFPQDVSVESGSIPFSFGLSSPGKVSPLRGCNLKEYEEQLNHLKKENFNLKVRIYYLEDFMGKKFNFKDDKENLHKANIELKVESEALKKELCDKQELIRQASALFSTQESKYKEQLEQFREQHEREEDELRARVYQLEKEVEDYTDKCLQEGKDLTQLCGLAFSSEGDGDFANDSVFQTQGLPSAKSLQLPGMSRSPLQGIFSLPAGDPSSKASQSKTPETVPDWSSDRIKELEHEVEQLQKKVVDLQDELRQKERTSETLEDDINNLKKELEDKEDKLADLEIEVTEKDQRVEQLMQDLETRHREIEVKDSTIQTLHDDLNKVEPEIEIKVQEIIERDRIIEEKIEQLQQQNKILVEIQITLDEKQKQIAELEARILETQQKNEKLTNDVELSCETIKNLACEMINRDKEIGTLKKELKKKEKKVRDLVAELKEALDMLKKAKWEAETSGGEDGVKEMVEEENERLWAELEQKKLQLMALESLKGTALKEAEDTINLLRRNGEAAEARIKDLERHLLEGTSAPLSLVEKSESGKDLELVALREKLEARDLLQKSQQAMIESLKGEVLKVREEIAEKKDEMREMKKELFNKNSDVQDFITNELLGRSKEVRELQGKLCGFDFGQEKQLEALRLFLKARNDELNSKEMPNNGQSQVQARSNSLSKLSEENSHKAEPNENDSNQSGCKSGRSNSFSQLENALYAQMGQKVYNTNQTFNTYVLSGDADGRQSSTEPFTSNDVTPAIATETHHVELNGNDSLNNDQPKSLLSSFHHRGAAKEAAVLLNPKILEEVEICSMPGMKSTSGNFEIQLIFNEMNKLKLETQSLRKEREILNGKISLLQQLNEQQQCQRENKPENEIYYLKKQLEESEEKCLIKDQVHEEIVFDFQDQIEILKRELQEAKKKITLQVLQMASNKYQESLQNYKQEIISLRKRLVDSHNACDLLRNRLEELVDFLEQIIEMDRKGIISLSHLSSNQRLSLQKTLDDSRALSHSLSHSLMIGTTDYTLADNEIAVNDQESMFSLPLNELPDEIDLSRLDSNRDLVPQYSHMSSFNISALDTTLPDFLSSSFAAKITSQVDSKDQEFEAIELKLDHLARVIQEKDDLMKENNILIKKLKMENEKLHIDLKLKHELLLQSDLINLTNSSCMSIASQSIYSPLSPSVQNDTNLSLHMSALQFSGMPSNLEYPAGIISQPAVIYENYSSSETLPPPPTCYSSQEDCRSVKSNDDIHSYRLANPSTAPNSDQNNVQDLYLPGDSKKVASNLQEQYLDKTEFNVSNRVPLDLEVSLEQPLLPPSFSLASPSESEAWSEPDRNVSLARIGLDTCALFTAAHDRSLSRSRLTRSAPFTSESEGEARQEEVREGSVGLVTPAKPKRRSDAAEVKRLSSKLKSMEQLNETLRAELHIYQTLNEQLDKRAERSMAKKLTFVNPQTNDKNVETVVSPEDQKTISIPSALLQEIRSLRIKLEEAIINNDLLRDQLEAALSGYLNEEARNLTVKLTAAQQEVKQNQDIINAAAATESQLRIQCTENESKAFELSKRLAEYMTSCQQFEVKIQQLTEELKEAKVNSLKTGDKLRELEPLLEEKESQLVDKNTKILSLEGEISSLKIDVKRLCFLEKEGETKSKEQQQYIQHLEGVKSDYESQMAEREAINKDLSLSISTLEQNNRPSAASDQLINTLQETLQRSEQKLLNTSNMLQSCESKLRLVTKERFALLGEKTRLEAKLATVITEAQLLQRDAREHSISPSEAQCRELRELQTHVKLLLSEKQAEQKEKELLLEEISTLKPHVLMKERQNKELAAVQASYKEVQNKHTELLDKNAALQESLTSLQKRYNSIGENNLQLHEQYIVLKDKLSSLQEAYDTLQKEKLNWLENSKMENSKIENYSEKMKIELKDQENKRKELISQLDAERCLTVNLQMQINNLQTKMKNSYDSTSESQDLPSPGSATSAAEFIRPGENYSQRKAECFSADIYRETRNYSKNCPESYPLSWSENKENLQPRSKKNLSLPHFDSSVISGESPDLGIGSDGQFSSMEKISVGQKNTGFYRHEFALVDDRNDLLCSVPSHSQLFIDNERLRQEREELSNRLMATKGTLKETLDQLAKSNIRKESVERAICRQLTKTHDVLLQAKGNLRQANGQQLKRSQSDQPEINS